MLLGRRTAFCGSFVSPVVNEILPRQALCIPRRSAAAKPRQQNRAVASLSVATMAPVILNTSVGQAVTLNFVLYALARTGKQHVLTSSGLLHALGLGVLLWSCLSWQGYFLCFCFLILGSAVTKIGKAEKEKLGIAEKRGGARGPENLWGAAGVAAICALGALVCRVVFPGADSLYNLLVLGYTASLATKMADTASSEIGKAYGSATYLVTSFKNVPKGTEGAVSVEGTLAGVVASLLAAGYAIAVGLLQSWIQVLIVIVAAFIATTAESFIGASVQEEYQWSNEFVNFLNTAIGAAVAMLLGLCVVGLN